ncbi:MAG: carbohydrate ABC transporter permease [Candidatus Nealsonbacteria bacterium]|nr:MAG: carbohydrate ABC transporter permease [Candidatus Nealsonbacteria bacterium]
MIKIKKENFRNILIYLFLTLLAMPILYGYSRLVMSSFSKNTLKGFFPDEFTLSNWRFITGAARTTSGFDVIAAYPSIYSCFLNTLYLALGVTILVTVISVLVGYMLSRFKFWARSAILASTLILHSFPAVSLMIGLYYVLNNFHLLDRVLGVILAKGGLFLPFGIWVMKGFFDEIPWDIEMSSLIDGATRIQTLYKVLFPIVFPGIAAISILSFIQGWSEYLFVYTFLRSSETWTLSSYVVGALGELGVTDYGFLHAVSVFYMFPVLIFFIFTQKYLMRVSVGGMKGGR